MVKDLLENDLENTLSVKINFIDQIGIHSTLTLIELSMRTFH